MSTVQWIPFDNYRNISIGTINYSLSSDNISVDSLIFIIDCSRYNYAVFDSSALASFILSAVFAFLPANAYFTPLAISPTVGAFMIASTISIIFCAAC